MTFTSPTAVSRSTRVLGQAVRSTATSRWCEALEARRLFAAGDLDPTFNGTGQVSLGGSLSGDVRGLDELGGKTVIVQQLRDATSPDPTLAAGTVAYARVDAKGKLDAKFAAKADPQSQAALAQFVDATGVAVQSNKSIVITGTLQDGGAAVWRLKSDGTLDPKFGTGGFARLTVENPSAPVIGPAGRILIAGRVGGNFAVERVNSNGTADVTFGTAGVAGTGEEGTGEAVAVRKDGRVVVAGNAYSGSHDPTAYVVQFSAGGALDASFTGMNENPDDFDIASSITLGKDGAAYVGVGGYARMYFAKLGPDGSRQATFGERTTFGSDPQVDTVRVSPDGEAVTAVVAFGNQVDGQALTSTFIYRVRTDGAPDYSFGGDANDLLGDHPGLLTADGARFGDVTADQKIVTAGVVGTYDNDTGELTSTDAVVSRRFGTGGAPSGVTPDGHLWVQGTAKADKIRVDPVLDANGLPGQVRVSFGKKVIASYPVAGIVSIGVAAGTGNDVVSVDAFNLPAALLGGDGDDVLAGGAGADYLHGGAGNDRLFGMAGDDYLEGQAGDDLLDGGDGADVIRGGYIDVETAPAGPAGNDTVTYEGRNQPVTVTTYDSTDAQTGNFTRNDGYAGEGDDVSGVSTIVGGNGNDTLRADATPENVPDATSAGVHLVGGPGDDLLVGSTGTDTLDGGPGADRLYGQSGDDTLLAKDGTADYLDGGLGNDTAFKDDLDAVFSVELIR